jgi:hypothetical protein
MKANGASFSLGSIDVFREMFGCVQNFSILSFLGNLWEVGQKLVQVTYVVE